jgi:acyl-CoA synthetase (AMP-forming)/AMP-acid ligase II
MTSALRKRLLAAASRPVLIDPDGRTRSGSELVGRVERLAGALHETGLSGECVGVWYENSFAAFEAYLAVEWIGATRLVLDPQAAPAEAQRMLQAADARAVLCDSERAVHCEGAVLRHDDTSPLEGTARLPEPYVPESRALHLYPRGVLDGEPLAVPISYGNWAATIELNCRLYRSGRYGNWDESREVMLTLQQLLHGTGLLGSFPFLHMGLPQVFVRAFDPTQVVELIDRHGVTSTGMTSGMLAVTLDALTGPLPRLKRVLYGGAPLQTAQLIRALELLGPVLVQVYGRLEGGWPLAILDQNDHAAIAAGAEQRSASCGRVAVDEIELDVCPSGELRTRSAMAVADFCDPDGWCGLGDVARIDTEGYVYLGGRNDSMVNTGYHVYPEEVQDALKQLPEVRAARVLGEPDERRGEVLVAYVVPAPGVDLDGEALRTQLRELLADYKVPRTIWIADTIDIAKKPEASEANT